MALKKVGTTGRYGSRYGVGIRKRLLKIEPTQVQRHLCPNCGSRKVRRQSKGIFLCSKCRHEFIGGAYLPQTLTGGIIGKMVSQKNFGLLNELEEKRQKAEMESESNREEGGTEAEPKRERDAKKSRGKEKEAEKEGPEEAAEEVDEGG